MAVKEGIWPANLIGAVGSRDPLSLLLLAQVAPQSSA
jgi:hypothetical protein